MRCSQIPAGFAHHALNIFSGLAGRGFPFTIDLIYVRLAMRHRGASHRQGSHDTERRMLSQGAKRSRRDASLAVTRPGTRRAADLQRIFQRFSSDWQTVSASGVALEYVYAIGKSVLLFKGIGYGRGWGQAAKKRPRSFAFVQLRPQFLAKRVSGDWRTATCRAPRLVCSPPMSWRLKLRKTGPFKLVVLRSLFS
jgi:hypothetical protein